MPVLFGLSALLQLLLAIHVVRSGRSLYWIFIIVSLPVLGSVVYLLAEVLPEYRHDPRARRALRAVGDKLNPERRRRQILDQLALNNSLENRSKLAEECLRLGDFENAERLYRECLSGPYATDPHFLFGLAHAEAELGRYAEARGHLEQLNQANPDYQSHDAHLLYARCLEALRDHAAALAEYEVLSSSYPGEEARFRYARLLHALGRSSEARAQLDAMAVRARSAPRYYRKKEADWLKQADALRANLPGA